MNNRRTNRRATILLMVVGMLAMLFVIVTAFLTLARVDRNKVTDTLRSTQVDSSIDSIHATVIGQLVAVISSKDGRILVSANPDVSTILEDVPQGSGIASLEPVRDASADGFGQIGGTAFRDLQALRWPSITSLERSAPAWAPRFRDLVLDSNEDGNKLNAVNSPSFNDFWIYTRNPLNDADGDGIPDSSFVLTRVALQMTNAIGGRPISMPSLSLKDLAGRDLVWQPKYTPRDRNDPAIVQGAPSPAIWIDYAAVDDPFNDPNNPDELDASVLQMRDLLRTARYIPAVRVVSEGAKVSLYSPGVYSDGNNPSVFNRDFVAGMFAIVRHPQDANRRGPVTQQIVANSDALFKEIAASSAMISQELARRGGILAAQSPTVGDLPTGNAQRDAARIPAIVRQLEKTYLNTLVARFIPTSNGAANSKKADWWQRFALIGGSNMDQQHRASARSPRADQLQAYSGATKLDPTEYLYNQTTAGVDPRNMYDGRHLLTAYSFSDDLARITGARAATATAFASMGASPMGLVAGQTKFYLGTIADPRPWPNRLRPQGIPQTDPRGAFNANGTFNPVTGARIIRQLADYYFEMLYSYEGWKLKGTPTLTGVGADVYAMRRQALMLATNTVAFAAPRRLEAGPAGPQARIAPVYYSDVFHDPVLGTSALDVHFGYQPQPFITQVVALGQVNQSVDPNTGQHTGTATTRIGLAVELYNPNEPDASALAGSTNFVGDPQALPLDEYTITTGDPTGLNAAGQSADPNITPPVHVLSEAFLAGSQSLPGRSFKVVSLRSGGSPLLSDGMSFLDRDGDIVGGKFDDTAIEVANNHIKVNLWRRVDAFQFPAIPNVAQTVPGPRWYLVDQFTVDITGVDSSPPPGQPQSLWTANVARDTTPTEQFGEYALASFSDDPRNPGRRALWNVVAEFEPGDPTNFYQVNIDNSASSTSVSNILGTQLARVDGPTAAGPFTPLPTMNANRTTGQSVAGAVGGRDGHTDLPIHGTRRPASFPTVGFMHFVARFAHLQRLPDAAAPTTTVHYTMGKFLGSRIGEDSGAAREFQTLSKVPADFGHMRLLHNSDATNAQSERVRKNGYFDEKHSGALPWGQLVYDFFTTLNAADPNNDAIATSDAAEATALADAVDPLRIPGRINVNTAPWYVLAGLPVIGVKTAVQASPGMPERWIDRSASPAFWSDSAGVLVGHSSPGYLGYNNGVFRSVRPARRQAQAGETPAILNTSAIDNNSAFYPPVPGASANANDPPWYRLGGDLAVAIAGYRDRIAYVGPPTTRVGAQVRVLDNWWDSYRRGAAGGVGRPFEPGDFATVPPTYSAEFANTGESVPYFPDKYGKVRASHKVTAGSATTNSPAFGFASLGEFMNVKGFDGALYRDVNGTLLPKSEYLADPNAPDKPGDFFRSVAFMALLDTQWLTTRSNTFTVYVSIADRENPQSSVRSQVLLDRSNVLPRAVRGQFARVVPTGQQQPIVFDDVDGDGLTTDLDREFVTVPGDAKPQIVSERRVGYYNAQFDD